MPPIFLFDIYIRSLADQLEAKTPKITLKIKNVNKHKSKPIYLTKNGEGDLVVMDIEAFTRREIMLALREELLAVEEARANGAKDYTIDEVTSAMKAAISEADNG